MVASDGYLHALNVSNGWDNMTPYLFLPPNARAAGLIVATKPEGGAIAYAATIRRCASTRDAVYAADLTTPAAQRRVAAFEVGDAAIAGTSGIALGRDGTVYVATADGAAEHANTLFALEAATLKVRARVAGAKFNSSPLVFPWKDKDAIVIAGGGKVHVFDAALTGGAVASGPALPGPAYDAGALSSWIDAQGVRWVAAPAASAIVAFKIIEQDGRPALQPGWTSRAIVSPLPPLVINGVLFAVSSGTRVAPATLYALDAATGKELWNSARSILTTVRGGISGGQGNVYVPGADGTLYAFGFEIEK